MYNVFIYAVVICFLIMLGACSSAPKNLANKPQYCYTDETIINKDDKVSSETKVECTDRPNLKNNMIVKTGIADSCRPHYYYVTIAGKQEQRRGFVCRKLDVNGEHGGWEIINPKFMY
jgi:hypothetical protein